MIFRAHGKPFFGRIEAWAFGDGPALENSVELEPQIVMQAPRFVLLNGVKSRSGAKPCRYRSAPRLARAAKIALGAIFLKGLAGGDGCEFSFLRGIFGSRGLHDADAAPSLRLFMMLGAARKSLTRPSRARARESLSGMRSTAEG